MLIILQLDTSKHGEANGLVRQLRAGKASTPDTMNGKRRSLEGGLQRLNNSKRLSQRNTVEEKERNGDAHTRAREAPPEGDVVRAYRYHCTPRLASNMPGQWTWKL